MRQRGFTILEIAVALTILSAGSAVLWYTVRSAARGDKQNFAYHAAVALAESELESLRGLPRETIKDTSYAMPVSGAELRVVRVVYDSAKIVASQPEITLDDAMSPVELRKPLEVRVMVFKTSADKEEGSPPSGERFSLDGPSGIDLPADPPLVSLTLKLPDYQWY